MIDTSQAASQPFVDDDLGLSIVFNGCIYNYQELGRELESRGHSFRSSGDTEVILKAWSEWGESATERLRGMFAFAIHDCARERTFLVRDRLGIKPLYFAHVESSLLFASTLPALLLADRGIDTSIDPVALHHYMSWHSVVPAPRTILRGVSKLPPATIRVVEKDGTIADRVYWRPSFERTDSDWMRSPESWRDVLLETLRSAVRSHMVSDVPLGVLLSGGVDSSLIVALMAMESSKELTTFSIGFSEVNGESGDEFEFSDHIAARFQTDHHKIVVSQQETLSALPDTIAAMSEPMISHDNVGFFVLSREVAKRLKVVLSGQGADEVFAGYNWYAAMAHSAHPSKSYEDAFFDRTHDILAGQLTEDYMITSDESRAFVEAHFAMPGANDPVDKALRIDTTVMLVEDPLKRVDNMTMAWGVEGRVPFLDQSVVDLAGRIPAQYKLAQGGKAILKDAARAVLPASIIDRPKGYFPVPALKYLEGPFLELVKDVVLSQAALHRNLFRPHYVQALLRTPAHHITKLRGSELWQVALLELWLQHHRL